MNWKTVEIHPDSKLAKVDAADAERIELSAHKARQSVLDDTNPVAMRSRKIQAEGDPVKIFFGCMQKEWYRKRHPISEPGIVQFIADAAKRNDENFFIRFGRILSSPLIKSVDLPMHKLRQFLAYGWIQMDPTVPDLCVFSDEAVTALAEIVLDDESITLDMIRNERGRELKLIKGRVKTRSVMLRKGKLLFS